MPIPCPPSPECLAFDKRLEQLLDRERSLDSEDLSHAQHCARCSHRWAETRLFLAALDQLRTDTDTEVPPGFTERVLAQVHRSRPAAREYRRSVLAPALVAIAASLLLGVMLFRPWQDLVPPHVGKPTEMAAIPPASETTMPLASTTVRQDSPTRVVEPLDELRAEWGTVLSRFTRQSAVDALAPARSLIRSDTPAETGPTTGSGTEPMPGVEALTAVPDAARSGLEPLASTAQRAFQLFLRDVGQVAVPKPNS